jgi:tetratricopeptide (TPR) repeat protein
MARSERPTRAELEEDRFVEWIMQAADFLKERMQFVIAAAAAVAVIVVLISYLRSAEEEARLQASTSFGQVLMADANGDVAQALEIAENLIREHRGTPAAAQGVVYLANRYFRQGRLDEAQRLYETYLEDYGDVDVLVFAAWSGVAACIESQGQFAQAAEKYVQYADRYDGQQASLALMSASRCYALAGETAAQKKALRRIARAFPTSPVVAKAREQLRRL